MITHLSLGFALSMPDRRVLSCSGRAGREGPGKCFRLYTESTFEGLPDSTVPEMRRADVASLVLQLKALGVKNLLAFPLPDPPPK